MEITGNLNQVIKELASDLAFTDDNLNLNIIRMVKDAAKDSAKNLKSKDVAFIDSDIEDVEAACYILTIAEVLIQSLPAFIESKHSTQH